MYKPSLVKYILDNQDNLTVQNFIMRDEKVKKIPGMNRYNTTALLKPIVGATRYYGIDPLGVLHKYAFVYSNGDIYMGDDSAQTLTPVKTGLVKDCWPEFPIIQVAQQSRMYVCNGYDHPVYYEGDALGTFQNSSLDYRPVNSVEKDQRLFFFERRGSKLWYSYADNPESVEGYVPVGNEKDSYIQNIFKLGDFVFIFKTDSIHVLRGNTHSTYRAEIVIPFMGMYSQRAGCVVNTAIVFVSLQDKEVYEFNGYNVRRLSGEQRIFSFAEEADLTRPDETCCVWDRRNNLFRLGFKGFTSLVAHSTDEAIFPTDEMGSDGFPKWVRSYGAKISCYSMWCQQGENTLVTGRSDTGLLMYHNRGQNWDNEAMECILRTDNIVLKDGYNTLWNSLFIKGKPSTSTITIRTYLNDRNSEGTKSSQTISQTGEEGTLAGITYKTQDTFNNWIPLLTGYSYGETLSIEIYDATVNKEIEIEWIQLRATLKSLVRNSLVG